MKSRQPLAFGALLLASSALLFTAACNSKSSDDVMAKVNGKEITATEVEKHFQNQAAGAQEKPTGEAATSLRLSILKDLIDSELLMARAQKLGLGASEDEVNRKLKEIQAPHATPEAFDAWLKERKLTVDDLKQVIRRNITEEKVVNKEITSRINITDQEIADYFQLHKAEYNLIETQYHLAHIVVSVEPNQQVRNLKNDKAQSAADARKKIDMIANMLDRGEDFGNVAMNYSEDPETAPSGGDLGFIPESAFKSDPATHEMLSRLQPHQHSPIITVFDAAHKPAGYRIVTLLDRQPAGQRELNDPRVQQAIREQLRTRREQLLKSAYYEVIHSQAKVQNFYAEKVLEKGGLN